MRRTTINRNQWWLQLTRPILGFDEGGEGAGGGQGTGEGAQGSGEGSQGGQGEGTPPAGKTYTEEDVAGLKSALQKERADRKKEAAELKAFQTAKQAAEDAEKTEVQRLTDSNSSLADRYAKLAAGYRTTALEQAVLAAAKAANFRDPSDAMRFDVVNGLGVEQDEDDPTQVTIDTAELTKRIKKLATDKPHYLAEAPRRGATKSGSTFNGSNAGKQGDDELAILKAKYPALRGI